MFILRVTGALDADDVPYALAGAYASSLHGAVRGTVDVDLVLRFERRDFERAEEALRSIGLTPRLPVTAAEVFNFREEYIARRDLVVWTFVNPADSSEIVKVILTHDLARLKTKHVDVLGRGVVLVAIDDLVRMKEAAGRPQDLEDARALKALA